MKHTKEQLESYLKTLEEMDNKTYEDAVQRYADIIVTTKRIKFLMNMPREFSKSDVIQELKKRIGA